MLYRTTLILQEIDNIKFSNHNILHEEVGCEQKSTKHSTEFFTVVIYFEILKRSR